MATKANKPFDRIVSDPKRLAGQPCIRGTRLTVRRVVSLLATYGSNQEVISEYPQLENEDIRQALLYAAANLGDDVVTLSAA